MAKINYINLYYHDEPIKIVKTNQNWCISKDSQYYYKTIQEQNFACLDGRVQKNLEYMMEESHYLNGVNPVCDIYYIDNQMLAYRTKIIEGDKIDDLQILWNLNLEKWMPFLYNLLTILNSGKENDYIFPDLFTNGNFLYNHEKNKLTIIDNDGIQIKENFPFMLDKYANEIANNNLPCYYKYFNFNNHFFNKDYNTFVFYAYFFDYFFKINLPQLLKSSKKEGLETLKTFQIHHYKDLWEEVQSLFSLEEHVLLNGNTISHLCQNYQIEEKENIRRLILR